MHWTFIDQSHNQHVCTLWAIMCNIVLPSSINLNRWEDCTNYWRVTPGNWNLHITVNILAYFNLRAMWAYFNLRSHTMKGSMIELHCVTLAIKADNPWQILALMLCCRRWLFYYFATVDIPFEILKDSLCLQFYKNYQLLSIVTWHLNIFKMFKYL